MGSEERELQRQLLHAIRIRILIEEIELKELKENTELKKEEKDQRIRKLSEATEGLRNQAKDIESGIETYLKNETQKTNQSQQVEVSN